MKAIANIFKIAFHQIRRWHSSVRFWFIVGYGIFFSYSFTQNISLACETMNMKISPWLFPQLLDGGIPLSYFLVPLIIIFCDAPFLDETQPYLIMRSKRRLWTAGKIAYVVMASLCYTMLLFVFTFLFNLPYIEFTADWGTMMRIETVNNALWLNPRGYFTVNQFIVNNIGAVQATLLSLFMFWLCGFFIGILTLCLNNVTDTRLAGPIVSGFFIIFAGIPQYGWTYINPLAWCMLGRLSMNGSYGDRLSAAESPSIAYAVTVLTVAVVILTAITIIRSRKITINVLPPV